MIPAPMPDEEPTVPIAVQSLGRHSCGGDCIFEGVSHKVVCSHCGEEGALVVDEDAEALDFEIDEQP